MKTVVEASHPVKRFKNFYAVNDISFEIERVKTFAFDGEDGFSKSTIVRKCGRLPLPAQFGKTHGSRRMWLRPYQFGRCVSDPSSSECRRHFFSFSGLLYDNFS